MTSRGPPPAISAATGYDWPYREMRVSARIEDGERKAREREKTRRTVTVRVTCITRRNNFRLYSRRSAPNCLNSFLGAASRPSAIQYLRAIRIIFLSPRRAYRKTLYMNVQPRELASPFLRDAAVRSHGDYTAETSTSRSN